MLRLQLDAHPELAIPAETGFGAVLGREPLLEALVALPTWPDLGLDPDPAFTSLRTVYRAYAARHGKRRWGDKTPGHVDYMEPLAEAVPEAHFIHLIRDGRD